MPAELIRTGLITPNLGWDEIVCPNGDPVPDDYLDNVYRVGEAFEAVRAVWGLPIYVVHGGGYRSFAYQRALTQRDPQHAAATSQHCVALALDLTPPQGVSVYDFWSAICDLAPRTAIRGIGYASPAWGGTVHIDCRLSAVVHHWRYPLT